MEQVQGFFYVLCVISSSGVKAASFLPSCNNFLPFIIFYLEVFFYLPCKQQEVQIHGALCSGGALKLCRCFCPFSLTLKRRDTVPAWTVLVWK
ncbi:hypothetical protein RLOC_00004657 [Lonchura striata]|uniref:Uncharacterized protein n=1 Tax=Lonchura striata TaxID=40157 RepID=A0A218UHR2_9PASE|nr:hypothetical protein RLOC_00004657 [Lonchura striata domestica]